MLQEGLVDHSIYNSGLDMYLAKSKWSCLAQFIHEKRSGIRSGIDTDARWEGYSVFQGRDGFSDANYIQHPHKDQVIL